LTGTDPSAWGGGEDIKDAAEDDAEDDLGEEDGTTVQEEQVRKLNKVVDAMFSDPGVLACFYEIRGMLHDKEGLLSGGHRPLQDALAQRVKDQCWQAPYRIAHVLPSEAAGDKNGATTVPLLTQQTVDRLSSLLPTCDGVDDDPAVFGKVTSALRAMRPAGFYNSIPDIVTIKKHKTGSELPLGTESATSKPSDP